MSAAPVDYALVVGYALLLGVAAIQYRRGKLRPPRLQLLVGTCLVWLAYGFLRLSTDSPIPAAEPLSLATDALAAVCLVAGLSMVYWWWRENDEPTAD